MHFNCCVCVRERETGIKRKFPTKTNHKVFKQQQQVSERISMSKYNYKEKLIVNILENLQKNTRDKFKKVCDNGVRSMFHSTRSALHLAQVLPAHLIALLESLAQKRRGGQCH